MTFALQQGVKLKTKGHCYTTCIDNKVWDHCPRLHKFDIQTFKPNFQLIHGRTFITSLQNLGRLLLVCFLKFCTDDLRIATHCFVHWGWHAGRLPPPLHKGLPDCHAIHVVASTTALHKFLYLEPRSAICNVRFSWNSCNPRVAFTQAFKPQIKVTPPVKTRAVLQSGISDVLQDMWHFWMPFHECSYFILLCAWVCIMTHRQIYIYIICVCVCELELFHVFVQPYACLKK